MNKQDYMAALQAKLSGLPHSDVQERLNFYGEMIDDRMEEGLTEQDAVLAIGDVDDIARQIAADIPLGSKAEQKAGQEGRLKAWEIVILVLGFPLWLSLLVAGAAIALSLYASMWAVIISLWAVFASLSVGALGCIGGGIGLAIGGNGLVGLVVISAGMACAGLSIALLFVCRAVTRIPFCLHRKLFGRAKEGAV